MKPANVLFLSSIPSDCTEVHIAESVRDCRVNKISIMTTVADVEQSGPGPRHQWLPRKGKSSSPANATWSLIPSSGSIEFASLLDGASGAVKMSSTYVEQPRRP